MTPFPFSAIKESEPINPFFYRKSVDVSTEFENTKNQEIYSDLHHPPAPGYTMRIIYLFRQQVSTVIDVNFLEQKIKIRNFTDDLIRRAFGVIENPSWEDFEIFLQDRCFPSTRGNAKDILRELGLTSYDPLQIVEKTEGRMAEDDMWMKFQYYPLEDYPKKGIDDGKD